MSSASHVTRQKCELGHCQVGRDQVSLLTHPPCVHPQQQRREREMRRQQEREQRRREQEEKRRVEEMERRRKEEEERRRAEEEKRRADREQVRENPWVKACGEVAKSLNLNNFY